MRVVRPEWPRRYRWLWSRAALGAALVACAGVSGRAQQAPPPDVPQFRSSVDVTSVDVTVVDGAGRPVTDLGPGDFTVRISGAPRRVVSAEWVPLATPARPDLPPPPPGFSSNENSSGGRLILIVVDQPNIRFGGALAIQKAVVGFIDRLQPADRVAAVGIGYGSPSTPFTADRGRVKEAIGRMAGQRIAVAGMREFYVSLSEAMAIRRGEPFALERVIQRECAGLQPGTPTYDICASGVQSEAVSIATDRAAEGDMTLRSLRALLTGLRGIDSPKTLVLVSEGFTLDDRRAEVTDLGTLASAARTSIYALKLEEPLFDMAQARAPDGFTRFDERRERSDGIETLAHAARGSLFNIAVAADGAFARIESELLGYYLLGIESLPADTDGKPHPIRVDVSRRGVTVRARRELVKTAAAARPTPRQAALSALATPLTLSALPLRLATFSLRGPDPSRIQLLFHAAVGSDYSSSKIVSYAYQINDKDGRLADSLSTDARLQPVMNGVPSPLQLTASASLPPGEYTMKFSVAEGDRVGTVEHAIRAELMDAAPYHLSELMVGGPPEARQLLRPTIGHTIAFGGVQGYIEAYGPGSGGLRATFEVAAAADGPPLLSADVTPQAAGDARAIFSHTLLARQLPPGQYALRATVLSGDVPLKTMTRGFEVATPPVLMTSAEGGASGIRIPGELYLPVEDVLFAREFHPEEAVRAETLKAFRQRVAAPAHGAFDAAAASFAQGDYGKAETGFKEAINADADSTAVLAYLAACFAAAGHDLEAASAWQTALIDGGDMPQIYGWLGDTLMRTRDLAQARAVLEEALKKWPSDVRFAKPLALLYATFGQGREAMRTLARHLEAHPDDVDGLLLGVEWIYQLHLSGATARSRNEDVKLARSYAAAYEKAKGPQTPLVREWMEFIQKRR